MVFYKTNFYIETILKQSGFDTFIARYIINLMENQIKYEKNNSISNFYKFIARKKIRLIIVINNMGLNEIEEYNFLYNSNIEKIITNIKNKINASNYLKNSSILCLSYNKFNT